MRVSIVCGPRTSGKERLAPSVEATARALGAWLVVRRGRPGGFFLAITRRQQIVGTGMTNHAVDNVLAKRQREAGVAMLSPHDFRRTFVGDLLDAGVDHSTVQQLAGHASVTTTAQYDRRGEATKRRVVAARHFPYRRGRG
jgi:site-specific recombinase XerD